METTEKIVEAYVRYMKRWFTIPNIKCGGQLEIDLLALETGPSRRVRRYHIESGVSISKSFSTLTNKPFSEDALKQRTKKASQRRTLGYFKNKKFGDPNVVGKLQEYGFVPGNYSKIIVSWGWDEDVELAASKSGILLWHFKDILNEIAKESARDPSYFIDDTMRTLQLMAKAEEGKV